MEQGPKQRRIICPACGKETAWEGNPLRPFCSGRCRTGDQARWATGEYRIPGERTDISGEDNDEKKDNEE